MKKILVKASKTYQITVDSGLNNFKTEILPVIKGDVVAIITDTNVEPLYYDKIKNLLECKTVFGTFDTIVIFTTAESVPH